jgi:hypothetical protein
MLACPYVMNPDFDFPILSLYVANYMETFFDSVW